jgi:hypothetical protein
MSEREKKIIERMEELSRKGYHFNKEMSTACAALYLEKSKNDFYILGLDGSEVYNPELTIIKL